MLSVQQTWSNNLWNSTIKDVISLTINRNWADKTSGTGLLSEGHLKSAGNYTTMGHYCNRNIRVNLVPKKNNNDKTSKKSGSVVFTMNTTYLYITTKEIKDITISPSNQLQRLVGVKQHSTQSAFSATNFGQVTCYLTDNQQSKCCN